MPDLAPVENTITIDALTRAPYEIYERLRREMPVARVSAVQRTMLTKAVDTKMVKDNPTLFSSNDPNTPMERAFQAHTLMRKDGEIHQRERGAMAPAFSPRLIRDHWTGIYDKIADEYVACLPDAGTIDLFSALSEPFASRVLAEFLGIPEATDAQMAYWSQTLINGAGNFGWQKDLFDKTDAANLEMNELFDKAVERHRVEQGPSALSVMVNADDPIEMAQIYSNIKIAIGGGINEPRDALCTILYGLLDNPDYTRAVLEDPKWFAEAFEEGVRWVAPIQVSSRLVMEDTEIHGCAIPKGDVVMTIQASAGHDEDVHEHGGEFDLFRPKKTHQSFGNGAHFCQGTHVSRMMLTRLMLPKLFDRFPNMKLDDPSAVVWSGFGFRGPLSLPVRLRG